MDSVILFQAKNGKEKKYSELYEETSLLMNAGFSTPASFNTHEQCCYHLLMILKAAKTSCCNYRETKKFIENALQYCLAHNKNGERKYLVELRAYIG